jgi:hypothetical protein
LIVAVYLSMSARKTAVALAAAILVMGAVYFGRKGGVEKSILTRAKWWINPLRSDRHKATVTLVLVDPTVMCWWSAGYATTCQPTGLIRGVSPERKGRVQWQYSGQQPVKTAPLE